MFVVDLANTSRDSGGRGFSLPLIAAAGPSPFCVDFYIVRVRKLPAAVWLDPKVSKPEPVGESNNTAEKQ